MDTQQFSVRSANMAHKRVTGFGDMLALSRFAARTRARKEKEEGERYEEIVDHVGVGVCGGRGG